MYVLLMTSTPSPPPPPPPPLSQLNSVQLNEQFVNFIDL